MAAPPPPPPATPGPPPRRPHPKRPRPPPRAPSASRSPRPPTSTPYLSPAEAAALVPDAFNFRQGGTDGITLTAPPPASAIFSSPVTLMAPSYRRFAARFTSAARVDINPPGSQGEGEVGAVTIEPRFGLGGAGYAAGYGRGMLPFWPSLARRALARRPSCSRAWGRRMVGQRALS